MSVSSYCNPRELPQIRFTVSNCVVKSKIVLLKNYRSLILAILFINFIKKNAYNFIEYIDD